MIIAAISSLGDTKSYISAGNTSTVLSPIEDYPTYTRTIVSDEYMPIVYATLINQMGWKHIAILYQNDVWGTGIYHRF